MNSYFATVEQQANPKLRGKPVAVLGSKARRSIIVASSIEAKKLGVKTAQPLHEALELCPNLTIVHGEPRKYSHVTKCFISIFEDYTDMVEIFSIDEAFLDITKTAHLFSKKYSTKQVILARPESDPGQARMTAQEDLGAIVIAREIKRRIREEIGSWISCSVGISSNKFLAKTGSNLEKSDGLVILNEQNKDAVLLGLPLKDFCGIGHRISARLETLGITSTKNLRNYPDILLKKEFGIITSRKLKKMAFGIDSSPVISWRERQPARSFSCSRTLNKDVTDVQEIKKQILFLFEQVAKKLRDDGYWAKEVGLWFRFKDFSGTGKSVRVGYWTCDGMDFYKHSLKILRQLNFGQPVRAIGVYAGKVQLNKNVSRSLLEEDKENEKILSAMDKVNNRYGEDVVTRASLSGRKLKEIVSGMGRDKF